VKRAPVRAFTRLRTALSAADIYYVGNTFRLCLKRLARLDSTILQIRLFSGSDRPSRWVATRVATRRMPTHQIGGLNY